MVQFTTLLQLTENTDLSLMLAAVLVADPAGPVQS